MEMDQLTSLAFTVNSNPGTYAVLLGSGVSTGAGIPTGWSIVLDLIRKLARVDGKEPSESELEQWYVDTYGTAPEYTALLEKLTTTRSERQGILRDYIEPTEDERAEGIKVSSAAHRAIARLAAGGFIRVIVTTNFDRLMEHALDEAGVDHDVVAGDDAIAGARPLVHSPCLVIKLHGDYRDSRIRNTIGELETYSEATDRLLDQVLDDYGLIVCGWSAAWDPALRGAILRQSNRRYGFFWLTTGSISEGAKELIDHRGAQVIQIESADQFFVDLSDRVNALHDFSQPHPLTVDIAVATLKRLIADRSLRIRLHDLVMDEAEKLRSATSDECFPRTDEEFRQDNASEYIRNRVKRYQSESEVLVNLVAVGCMWGEEDEHDLLWGQALERVANRSKAYDGNNWLLGLRNYPAVRVMYAGGISALNSGRYTAIRSLTTDQMYYRLNDKVPMVAGLHPWRTFEDDSGQMLHEGTTRAYTPVSDHLHDSLRDTMRQVIPSDERYTVVFDRFEFLLAMILLDLKANSQDDVSIPRPFVGSWVWRNRWAETRILPDWIRVELDDHDQGGPLSGGLFGGSVERAESAFKLVSEHYDESRSRLT